jgi:octaprenyl-diphosphate synthase
MNNAAFQNYQPTLQPLLELCQTDLTKVNSVILGSVQQSVPLITDIAQHIVRSGGKRLRPCLTIACAKLLNLTNERHINLAASVELIHTATLLHDDVVDESAMRRGIETANHVWSNQASVLVGDFLLSRAFQLMVADSSIPVLKLLSDASATISQGEVKQLAATGDLTTDKELYLEIINAKTAVLFSAACEIAPIIGEAYELRESFANFGSNLGIAFQLVDDALDYAGDSEVMGKNIGDDLREGKITLPIIIAYENATSAEQNFWHDIFAEDAILDNKKLNEVSKLIAKYDGVKQTLSLAREYLERADNDLISINGESQTTAALKSTLAFCLNRQN